ncbi:odorant receptor 45a-like [Stomoxys calcitrans]|uniref:odorant receptor 45a-like n=1 Tax=Stomoxys calcitrans TaxID=35570 RepID=UPI0027E31604|nr:odorant receptor 45a-like [Stomoxys calcitrans]
MWFLPKSSDALPSEERLHHYLFVQRYCFAGIGIDPTSLTKTVFNRLLAWIPMLCLFFLIFPLGLYALEYMKTDLSQMVIALSPMWQMILAVNKFFLFMWNREKIVRLVREVYFWTLKANDAELVILSDEIRIDIFISLLYCSSVCLSALLAVVSPFLTASIFAFKGYGFWDSLELPFKARYFVDPKMSIWSYALNYIWIFFAVYYAVHGTVAIDSLFSWFMRNISAQFRILNLRFKLAANIVDAEGKGNDRFHEEFKKSIIECIEYHRRVIDLVEKFNDVYRDLIFVKILISCVQMACLTFLFQQGGYLHTQIFNISFLITITIQLMLYCHGGQRIKEMVGISKIFIHRALIEKELLSIAEFFC